jgi:hypothetical protein
MLSGLPVVTQLRRDSAGKGGTNPGQLKRPGRFCRSAGSLFQGGEGAFAQVIAAAWLVLLCAFAPAHAEKRVALAVGNGAYVHPTGSPIPSTTRAACAMR